MVAIASACSHTVGVAGDAANSRSPPSSGALPPSSTILPLRLSRNAGSRSRRTADIVRSDQSRAGPMNRSRASVPSGTERSAIRIVPSPWMISAPASRAASTAATARPGRTMPLVDTSSGTRRICPSGSASMTSVPKPAAASANMPSGAPTPGARHSPDNAIGCRARISVFGRLSRVSRVSSTKPSTAGAAASASASWLSPSGVQRSGPDSSISSAMHAGSPAAIAATIRASSPRGQGQAPKADSVARSISTMTTSGGAALRCVRAGRMRSNRRSLGMSRSGSGTSSQAARAVSSATAPASVGQGMRRWPRIDQGAPWRAGSIDGGMATPRLARRLRTTFGKQCRARAPGGTRGARRLTGVPAGRGFMNVPRRLAGRLVGNRTSWLGRYASTLRPIG